MKKLLRILLIFIFIFNISSYSFASEIEYTGKDGLLKFKDNLFEDFGSLVPGDLCVGKVYIDNTSNDNIEVYFKSEPYSEIEYLTDAEYELLSLVKISIFKTYDDKREEIYNGDLLAQELEEYISVGEYLPGSSEILEFELYVPEQVNNNYALNNIKIKWYFNVKQNNIISTGDEFISNFTLFAFFCGISLFIVLKRKEVRFYYEK